MGSSLYGREPLTNADIGRIASKGTKGGVRGDRPEKPLSQGAQQAQTENAQLRQMIEGGAPHAIVHQAANDLIVSRLSRTVTPTDWMHRKGLTISHLLTPHQFGMYQQTGTWNEAPTDEEYRARGYINQADPDWGQVEGYSESEAGEG